MHAFSLPRLHVITDTRRPSGFGTAQSGRDPHPEALPGPAALTEAPFDRTVDSRGGDPVASLGREPITGTPPGRDPLTATSTGRAPLAEASPGSPAAASRRDPLVVAEAALAAGARLIQVRPEDHYDDREAHDLAAELMALCERYGATCLINDRVHISQAVGAHGVHLGARDLPIDAARRILAPGAIIGGTCREPEAARAARRAGATYLGVGPVWATTTKTGLPTPIGLEGLAAVCAAVDLPVIAIGGITASRAAECRAAGAHGVAVVGAIAAAEDPAAATAELLAALDETPKFRTGPRRTVTHTPARTTPRPNQSAPNPAQSPAPQADTEPGNPTSTPTTLRRESTAAAAADRAALGRPAEPSHTQPLAPQDDTDRRDAASDSTVLPPESTIGTVPDRAALERPAESQLSQPLAPQGDTESGDAASASTALRPELADSAGSRPATLDRPFASRHPQPPAAQGDSEPDRSAAPARQPEPRMATGPERAALARPVTPRPLHPTAAQRDTDPGDLTPASTALWPESTAETGSEPATLDHPAPSRDPQPAAAPTDAVIGHRQAGEGR